MIYVIILIGFIALFATALMGLHFAESRPLRSAMWAMVALLGWGAFFTMGSLL